MMKPFHALAGLAAVFILASLFLIFLTCKMPQLKSQVPTQIQGEEFPDSGKLFFPGSIDDVKNLSKVLSRYKKDHYVHTVLLFCAAYLYKQTFAIPGSVFLNLLAGAIFGLWRGFFLACTLTACGATFCFLLSKVFGKEILTHYFYDKLRSFQEKVSANRDGLFFFLLFLRLFPMSPNWFINMASPVLGVPVHLFFPSVLIGLMPYNFICCQMGCILSELHSIEDILTGPVMFKMAGVALISALPGVFLRMYSKRKLSKEKVS